MTNLLTPLTPQVAAQKLADSELQLIDVREPDEYAREHIRGARSLPVSALADARLPKGGALFYCRSGMRTQNNCLKLQEIADDQSFLLEGGLDAWKAAGLPVETDRRAPLEMNRQVQITAGAMALGGALLGAVVHPAFFGLSGFVGAGLLFAGITGWCGMANLLALMPWNRRVTAAA